MKRKQRIDYHIVTHALISLLAMLATVCAFRGEYDGAAGLLTYAVLFSLFLELDKFHH